MIGRVVALYACVLAASVAPAAARPATDAPVRDTTRTVTADDSLTVLAARAITFPSAVAGAAYDPESGTVFAACYVIHPVEHWSSSLQRPTEVRDQRLVAYALATRAVAWSRDGDDLPLRVLGGRLLVHHGQRMALLDPATGAQLADWSDDQVLLAEDTLVVVREGDDVVRLDPRALAETWRRRLGIANRASFVERRADTLAVVGDGVAMLGLGDGAGWERTFATGRADVVSSTAMNLMVMAAGAATLNLFVPTYWGTRLDDLGSRPLMRGDRVVLAADTVVACLRRDSGTPVWTRRLGAGAFAAIRARARPDPLRPAPAELPGHLLLGDGADAIAVLTMGVAPNGRRLWRADPPSIALLDPANGDTRVRAAIPDAVVALDYRRVRRGHVVMTPARLVLFDDALKVVETHGAPAGHLTFDRFEDDPARLLVRTNAGLAELDPDSLGARWQRRLGGDLSRATGAAADGRAWWSGRGGLLALPAAPGAKPLGVPFHAGRIHIDAGVAVASEDATVTLIALPGRRLD